MIDSTLNQARQVIRQFYVSMICRYAFLLFLLLWGEPDLLFNINNLLSVIVDYISHGMGRGVG